MVERTFLATLTAAILMMFCIIGNTQQATAQQNPNICTYRVDIAGIPQHCFPINLVTEWTCAGGLITIQNSTYINNGVFFVPLNPPGAPPCPPACLFNWASLSPPIIPTPLNRTTVYTINGCCYVLTTSVDAAGMIVITIRPCVPDVLDTR